MKYTENEITYAISIHHVKPFSTAPPINKICMSITLNVSIIPVKYISTKLNIPK